MNLKKEVIATLQAHYAENVPGLMSDIAHLRKSGLSPSHIERLYRRAGAPDSIAAHVHLLAEGWTDGNALYLGNEQEPNNPDSSADS